MVSVKNRSVEATLKKRRRSSPVTVTVSVTVTKTVQRTKRTLSTNDDARNIDATTRNTGGLTNHEIPLVLKHLLSQFSQTSRHEGKLPRKICLLLRDGKRIHPRKF